MSKAQERGLSLSVDVVRSDCEALSCYSDLVIKLQEETSSRTGLKELQRKKSFANFMTNMKGMMYTTMNSEMIKGLCIRTNIL